MGMLRKHMKERECYENQKKRGMLNNTALRDAFPVDGDARVAAANVFRAQRGLVRAVVARLLAARRTVGVPPPPPRRTACALLAAAFALPPR